MMTRPPAISCCADARAILLLGLALVFCGCEPGAVDSKSAAPGAAIATESGALGSSSSAAVSPPAGNQQTAKPAEASAVVPVDSPAVRIADRAELDRLIGTHRGKVVLVDFWATWCGPCVQQFPHTVELSRANPDQLAVISVSMDEPEDLDRVQKFVLAKNAQFEHLLSKYGVGQEGFEAFQIDDGSIPHYQIYDRAGVLRHKLQDSAKLAGLIDALLKLDPAE